MNHDWKFLKCTEEMFFLSEIWEYHYEFVCKNCKCHISKDTNEEQLIESILEVINKSNSLPVGYRTCGEFIMKEVIK